MAGHGRGRRRRGDRVAGRLRAAGRANHWRRLRGLSRSHPGRFDRRLAGRHGVDQHAWRDGRRRLSRLRGRSARPHPRTGRPGHRDRRGIGPALLDHPGDDGRRRRLDHVQGISPYRRQGARPRVIHSLPRRPARRRPPGDDGARSAHDQHLAHQHRARRRHRRRDAGSRTPQRHPFSVLRPWLPLGRRARGQRQGLGRQR